MWVRKRVPAATMRRGRVEGEGIGVGVGVGVGEGRRRDMARAKQLGPKSLVRIVASIALCRSSLNLHRPERHMDTIFLRALFVEHLQPPEDTASWTLLANDTAGQSQWSSIAGGVPNIAFEGQLMEGTINVMYYLVDDPDPCECIFCPPLFRKMGVLGSGLGLMSRVAHNSRDISQVHGSRAAGYLHGNT